MLSRSIGFTIKPWSVFVFLKLEIPVFVAPVSHCYKRRRYQIAYEIFMLILY